MSVVTFPLHADASFAPTSGAAERISGAYVPELSARMDDDRRLSDGAKRCGRKLAEIIYRRNRDGRAIEITVSYLMKALRRSRRTVQRYLRQLEKAGYIAVEVVAGWRSRLCTGLAVHIRRMVPAHGWKSG